MLPGVGIECDRPGGVSAAAASGAGLGGGRGVDLDFGMLIGRVLRILCLMLSL